MLRSKILVYCVTLFFTSVFPEALAGISAREDKIMSSFQTSEFLLSHQILTLDNGLRAIENCKTFDTENWKLRPATTSDRTRVCDFVVDVHLEATGYNEEAREQQRLELPDDFPELFSDEVWINTTSFLCFSSRDVDADERPLLIGCIGMRHHSNETAEIGYFCVHNKYRRLGIGRSLLRLSLSWLKRISSAALFPYSYKKIVLITLLDILDEAIKLYKSEGFVVQEEKQSKFYTGLIMALDIARYGSKVIELARYQISEVELTRAAYASEFSMDELSCEHMILLESMSVTGEWSAAQICSAINFTVQIWKNAAVQIWLPRNYPDERFQFCLLVRGMPLNVQKRIKLQLLDFLYDIEQGDCCCLPFLQNASDYCRDYFEGVPLETSIQLSQKMEPQLAQFLIYFHHIKSSSKMRDIVENARNLSLGGLWKVDFPGVIIVEGELDNILEYVRRIQKLRWQHMVVRGEHMDEKVDEPRDLLQTQSDGEIVHSIDERRRLPRDLELLGSMSELAQRCSSVGLHDLFMTCMKSP